LELKTKSSKSVLIDTQPDIDRYCKGMLVDNHVICGTMEKK